MLVRDAIDPTTSGQWSVVSVLLLPSMMSLTYTLYVDCAACGLVV